jgi:hypothetical protein
MTFRSLRRKHTRIACMGLAVAIAALAALLTPHQASMPSAPALTEAASAAPEKTPSLVPADEPVVKWPESALPVAKITATVGAQLPQVEFTEIAENVFCAQTPRYHAVI